MSVASNIAEGWGRQSNGEYKQFLGMAHGSNAEVQTQLTIARRLGFGIEAELRTAEGLSIEISRMLAALIRKIVKSSEQEAGNSKRTLALHL